MDPMLSSMSSVALVETYSTFMGVLDLILAGLIVYVLVSLSRDRS